MNRNFRTLGQITVATAGVLATLAVSLAFTPKASRIPRPQLDLVTLGGRNSLGCAINARGDFAGVLLGGTHLGFRYSGEKVERLNPGRRHGLDILGEPTYILRDILGIASDGTVLGKFVGCGDEHTVLWKTSSHQDMPTIIGTAMNASGEVVGLGIFGEEGDAARWRKGVGLTRLAPGNPMAIDADGRVCGHDYRMDRKKPAIWQGDRVRILPGPESDTVCFGISGPWVVGATFQPTDGSSADINLEHLDLQLYLLPWQEFFKRERPRAMTWRDGKPEILRGVTGEAGIALGVNTQGTIVGVSTDADGNPVATVWLGGRPTDLNTLVPSGTRWRLVTARAINESGFVVGTAALGDRRRAYRFGPIAPTKDPSLWAAVAPTLLAKLIPLEP